MKDGCFHPTIMSKNRMSALMISTSDSAVGSSQCRVKKNLKIFTHNVSKYRRLTKPAKLMNEFSKIAKYKINTQKSITFLTEAINNQK
jgi:uncharacterized membrane protein YgaE (UPF0421/DUF939 family)